MADWRIDNGILNGYPHVPDISEGYDWAFPFQLSKLDNLGWGMDSEILNGFPHFPAIIQAPDWTLPFRFRLSNANNFGWKQDTEMLDNYPFVYFRVLEPPPPPPPPMARIMSINMNVLGRYIGSETDVDVTLGLDFVVENDGVTIQLYRYGIIHYEHTNVLANGAETYTHTIPANAFVGLAVGGFEIQAKLCRDGEVAHETVANYTVVATPTITFESLTPNEVQLPISSPKTLSSRWRVVGEGINTLQGNATIGTLQSTTFNINASQTLYATFSNVANMDVGSHAIVINLTASSNRYGNATISSSQTNAITVLAPIPEPEIGEVNLSVFGRYIGSETDVVVHAINLQHILDGDIIIIRLRQGSTDFYEHRSPLQSGATTYTHNILQSTFIGLAVGDYMIQVVIERNGTVRCSALASYWVRTAPTVQLLYVSPNTIQLPMATAETIVVTLQTVGEGIDTIVGAILLDDTSFTSSVNTTDTQFSVPFIEVNELNPRGYSITANLTITSERYGTVTISEIFNNALRVLAEIVPVYRNLRSNTIYIYDGFTLVHILQSYISLKWVRRYNRSGEFTLQLPNTPENVTLAQTGYIIAKDNDDEAGFIEDVVIGDNIEIKGGFISNVLSRRVANFTSEHLVNLQTTADSLVRANFINTSSNRIIQGFRIADYTISSQSALARIDNGSIEQWLENQDVGFKVAFKPTESAFEFSLYDGRRSAAVFCENFRNITDQQYFNQTARAKNVVIVEGAEEQRITIGNVQGLERREAYTRAGRFHPVEFGNQFLRQNEPIISLDVKIVDPYTPFEYKKDYDIGDIVTIVSESHGVTITENILEISEYYDKTGFHLYVVFGRIPRDLLTELRDNSHRIDHLETHPESVIPDIDLETIKNLIIPPIVDEVFNQIEFPPLPDWLSIENLREMITETSEEVVDRRLRELLQTMLPELLPEILPGIPGGGGSCIVIDRLPTQAQIDNFPDGSVVHVYNPNVVFTPPS